MNKSTKLFVTSCVMIVIMNNNKVFSQRPNALPFDNDIEKVETLVDNLYFTDVIAIDQKGNMYMSGYFKTSGPKSPKPIIKITPSGKTSVFAEIKYGRPGGMHFDERSGYLYLQLQLTEDPMTDCQLIRIDKNGQIEIVLDRVEKVGGLTVDAKGNIFLSGTESDKLIKVSASGKVEIFASGSMFDMPLSMVFDKKGNMFCSNWQDGKIHKISPKGDVSLFSKLPGYKNVLGWLVYHKGDMYATGFASNRVYKINSKGEVSVIAGSGIKGIKDGSPREAQFNHPNGLNISPSGDALYVADWIGEGRRQTLRKLYFKK